MAGSTLLAGTGGSITATRHKVGCGNSASCPIFDILELDFSPHSNDFFLSEKDLYWSRVHDEISHKDLFHRAIDTRKRLAIDLAEKFKKLSRSRRRRFLHPSSQPYDLELEERFELRLTGHASKDATRILMTPCVWVRCDDIFSKHKIQKRLDELEYLKSPTYSKVHPFCSPVKPGHRTEEIFVKGLDLTEGAEFQNGQVLHVHIANQSQSNSSFGWICCATITQDSSVLSQRFSRLGGLLRVNKSLAAGMTTAHGMLSFFLDQNLATSAEDSDNSSSSSDGDDSDDNSTSDVSEFDNWNKTVLGCVDVLCEREWIQLLPFDTINFVAQARMSTQDQDWELRPSGFDSDYAILKDYRSGVLNNLINCYEDEEDHVWGDPDHVRYVEGHTDENELEASELQVLLGPRDTLTARLLPGSVPIVLQGIRLLTRKLSLPGPLALGTSGTWVVRNENFCGMIIAIFENEPFALMLTASRILADIQRFGSKIGSVLVLSSPDVLPERALPDPLPGSKIPQHDWSSTESDEHAIFSTVVASQGSPLSSAIAQHAFPQVYPIRSTVQSSAGHSIAAVQSGFNNDAYVNVGEAAALQSRRLAAIVEEEDDDSNVTGRLVAHRERNDRKNVMSRKVSRILAPIYGHQEDQPLNQTSSDLSEEVSRDPVA